MGCRHISHGNIRHCVFIYMSELANDIHRSTPQIREEMIAHVAPCPASVKAHEPSFTAVDNLAVFNHPFGSVT